MDLWFSEASAVEFTADARLGGAGNGILSDRTLRRIKFGMVGIEPELAFGLRCGPILARWGGVPAVAISCLKSLTIMSSALRAS